MLLMRLNQLINPLCIPLFDGQNPWFLGEICWDALLVTLTLTSLVAIPLHFLWMRTGRQGGVGYTWKISPKIWMNSVKWNSYSLENKCLVSNCGSICFLFSMRWFWGWSRWKVGV
jgi:hypothetical protein